MEGRPLTVVLFKQNVPTPTRSQEFILDFWWVEGSGTQLKRELQREINEIVSKKMKVMTFITSSNLYYPFQKHGDRVALSR